MFRRENPQHGRMREFWQYGVEVLGSYNPSSDAQVIKMAWDVLEDLGLKDLSLEINSIGCRTDRANVREILISYFEKKKNAKRLPLMLRKLLTTSALLAAMISKKH
jgi:histidyl-tRNA synthetase